MRNAVAKLDFKLCQVDGFCDRLHKLSSTLQGWEADYILKNCALHKCICNHLYMVGGVLEDYRKDIKTIK